MAMPMNTRGRSSLLTELTMPQRRKRVTVARNENIKNPDVASTSAIRATIPSV